MIAITPHMHILLATQTVDFRKGIDGLAAVCRNILDKDPFNGYLFVFANKTKHQLKYLSMTARDSGCARKDSPKDDLIGYLV